MSKNDMMIRIQGSRIRVARDKSMYYEIEGWEECSNKIKLRIIL